MDRIDIYGAGAAGMVAAVNLARQGYEVRVMDKEKVIGGSAEYHPSAHATPLLPDETWEYIGIDLSDVFTEFKQLKGYVGGKPISISRKGVYCVEKGRRKGSLERKLYEIALREGVNFEFQRSLMTREEVEKTPPNTIIATGVHYEMFEALGIPYQQILGYYARRRAGVGDYGFIWFDDYTTDYGYVVGKNGQLFALLLSRTGIKRGGLERFQAGIRRAEGIEFEGWHLIDGPIPTRVSDNPRLFYKDKILAGTLSGMIDPFYLFGIVGALVSGKIAALAVTDKDKAAAEFERCTSGFSSGLFLKTRVYDHLPRRVPLLYFLFSHPRLVPGWALRRVTAGFPAPAGDYLGRALKG